MAKLKTGTLVALDVLYCKACLTLQLLDPLMSIVPYVIKQSSNIAS